MYIEPMTVRTLPTITSAHTENAEMQNAERAECRTRRHSVLG